MEDCVKCGGPLPAGVTQCPWCGNAIVAKTMALPLKNLPSSREKKGIFIPQEEVREKPPFPVLAGVAVSLQILLLLAASLLAVGMGTSFVSNEYSDMMSTIGIQLLATGPIILSIGLLYFAVAVTLGRRKNTKRLQMATMIICGLVCGFFTLPFLGSQNIENWWIWLPIGVGIFVAVTCLCVCFAPRAGEVFVRTGRQGTGAGRVFTWIFFLLLMASLFLLPHILWRQYGLVELWLRSLG